MLRVCYQFKAGVSIKLNQIIHEKLNERYQYLAFSNVKLYLLSSQFKIGVWQEPEFQGRFGTGKAGILNWRVQ